MGGYGSGRHSDRFSTDDCLIVRLPELRRIGMFQRQAMNRHSRTWTRDGATLAHLTIGVDIDCFEPFPCLKISGVAYGKNIECLVQLESFPMRFGGERWYALCPKTGIRCTTLVLPPGTAHFASVKGWGTAYSSQRECATVRGCRMIDKMNDRLNNMSKYTRRPKRQKLIRELHDRHEQIEAAFALKTIAQFEIYDRA